MTTYAWLSPE